MAKKSRQRKFDAKRPPEAGQNGFSLASATHKPWQIAAVCLVLAVVTILAYQRRAGTTISLSTTMTSMSSITPMSIRA